MDRLRQDLRIAWRSLVKRPGFTLVIVLTLAIGIGGNTAIFSVVNGVMLRPLPYRDPGRLVVVWQRHEAAGFPEIPLSLPAFLDHREQAKSFSSIAMIGFGGKTITGVGEPESIQCTQVSPELFAMLGATPLIGRPWPVAAQYAGQCCGRTRAPPVHLTGRPAFRGWRERRNRRCTSRHIITRLR